MDKKYMEVCVQHVESAINGQLGGADRLELCGHLELGGVTPSYSQVNEITKHVNIPINMMVRPRGGDFLYSEYEKSMMLYDIEMAKQFKLNGIVVGVLTSSGEIDVDFLEKIVNAKGNLKITFHRALDEVININDALNILIAYKVDTVLTSGGRKNVIEGINILKELIENNQGKIEIMPGCGVTSKNVGEIIKVTKANWIHLTGKTNLISNMKYYNKNLYDSEFKFQKSITSYEEIKSVRDILDKL